MLTDRQLREMLQSIEVDEAPDAAFEANLLGALQTARSSRSAARSWSFPSGLRLVLQRPALAWLVIALVVASLLAVALAGGFHPRPFLDATKPQPSAAVAPGGAAQLHVGLKVALPRPPETIAVDPAGGIWETSGGEVLRVLAATAKAGPPLDLHGDAASAMVGRSNLLWIASREGNSLFEADGNTGAVLASATVTAPLALAIDTSTVIEGAGGRVAGQTPSPTRGASIVVVTAGGIVEVASGTLAVRWRASVPGMPVLAAEGGGRIWVAARPVDDATALVLAAYAAGTGEPVGVVRLHSGWTTPRAIAVQQTGPGAGSAWVPDPDAGTIAVVDPTALAVVRNVAIGSGVTEIAVRPGGDFVTTYAAGVGGSPAVNAIAVVKPTSDAVMRYVVRTDDPGSGRGVVGLSFETEGDGNCCVATVWKVWFGMDWQGDPSVGRVNTAELP